MKAGAGVNSLGAADLRFNIAKLVPAVNGEPSTWQDQLVRHGQSLHHIAFEVKGMAEQIEMLAQHGLQLVQRGEYQGGRYAYVDGQDRFGTVIELLEND